LRGRLAAAGELSLAGEVRSIGHLEKRVSAAQQMGFLEFLGPIPHGGSTIAEQLRQMYVACGDISEAVLRLRTAPTSQAT
jgi:predicted ATP-dependent serine protease